MTLATASAPPAAQHRTQYIANLLQGVPGLTLRERFTFCMAPVHVQSDLVCRTLYDVRLARSRNAAGRPRLHGPLTRPPCRGLCGRLRPQYAAQFASPGRTVRLRMLHDPIRPVTNMHDMADLEARNNAADVYLWLGLRLHGFVDLVAAEAYRDSVSSRGARAALAGSCTLTRTGLVPASADGDRRS